MVKRVLYSLLVATVIIVVPLFVLGLAQKVSAHGGASAYYWRGENFAEAFSGTQVKYVASMSYQITQGGYFAKNGEVFSAATPVLANISGSCRVKKPVTHFRGRINGVTVFDVDDLVAVFDYTEYTDTFDFYIYQDLEITNAVSCRVAIQVLE